jgi:hypothetical protein
MSSRPFGGSRRRANLVGIVSLFAGAAGAALAAVLWIHRLDPDSRILGRLSVELTAGGVLSDQLAGLTAVLGLVAVITSLMSSIGGEGGGRYLVGLVLGLAALTFPVANGLNVFTGPLTPSVLD